MLHTTLNIYNLEGPHYRWWSVHSPHKRFYIARSGRVAGHCVGHKEEEASHLVLWQPQHRHTKRGRSGTKYIHTLLEDTGFATIGELRIPMLEPGEEESMLSKLALDQTICQYTCPIPYILNKSFCRNSISRKWNRPIWCNFNLWIWPKPVHSKGLNFTNC